MHHQEEQPQYKINEVDSFTSSMKNNDNDNVGDKTKTGSSEKDKFNKFDRKHEIKINLRDLINYNRK